MGANAFTLRPTFSGLPPFKYGGARGNTERKTEYVSYPYSAEPDQTRAVWACILPFGVLLHWDHPTIPCSHSDPFYAPSIRAPGLSAGSEAEQEPSHYTGRTFHLTSLHLTSLHLTSHSISLHPTPTHSTSPPGPGTSRHDQLTARRHVRASTCTDATQTPRTTSTPSHRHLHRGSHQGWELEGAVRGG